ncbi:MAG TPA: 16S rRNA (adenine(1518)-N(6)/adenine(1519)-N(6))-dimethyltransferase RsmA [Ignavibacteriaceae bacterium]|nr:16S rRNA (adenine(1518)-N(6)/adenine(1519)-N(6))-dimethyltransferase RsmA [Ignavibacteriaceae bacterium]
MKFHNKPKKRFGQNFLQDENILNKIVREINPQSDDAIIEIGPGYGVLTQKLLSATENLIAVEIDNELTESLRERFPQLNLINEDFLKTDLSKLSTQTKKLRIVGNIPYNITSPILFKLIENNKLIKDAVFMVQLEVAKRMTADRGTKDYGILAVVLKYFSETKLCFKISPNVFYPKPKVFSALVHIKFKEIIYPEEEQKLFIQIVKAAFGNRRKTLKNSLGNSIFHEIDFSNSGIDLSLRAENLSVDDFIKLTQFVRTSSSGIDRK